MWGGGCTERERETVECSFASAAIAAIPVVGVAAAAAVAAATAVAPVSSLVFFLRIAFLPPLYHQHVRRNNKQPRLRHTLPLGFFSRQDTQHRTQLFRFTINPIYFARLLITPCSSILNTSSEKDFVDSCLDTVWVVGFRPIFLRAFLDRSTCGASFVGGFVPLLSLLFFSLAVCVSLRAGHLHTDQPKPHNTSNQKGKRDIDPTTNTTNCHHADRHLPDHHGHLQGRAL